jgi:hypothetical protein
LKNPESLSAFYPCFDNHVWVITVNNTIQQKSQVKMLAPIYAVSTVAVAVAATIPRRVSMKEDPTCTDSACRSDVECQQKARTQLTEIAERIIDHCQSSPCYTHIDSEPIPAEAFVADIIDMFRELLSPVILPARSWIR